MKRICIISFAIYLRILFPINPNPGLIHDDSLMVMQAYSIRSGEWLGNWETLGDRLLAKSPGYSIFLNASSTLPWSQVLTTFIIFVIASLIIARELDKITKTNWLGNFFLLIALINPVFYGAQASRVYRDQFISSLILFLFALFMFIVRIINETYQSNRIDFKVSLKLFTTISLFGLVSGYYIITKISWQNILLFYLALFSFALYVSLKFEKYKARNFKITFAILGLMTIACIAPSSIIKKVNYDHYKVALVEDFGYGEFAAAIRTWSSINSLDPKDDFIIIDSTMKNSAYKVSETARTLKPFLEGRGQVNWEAISCMSTKICDDTSAWFAWDLRDAARESGLANSPLEFQQTFGKLNAELESACKSGQIECGEKGLAPMILPISRMSKYRLVDGIGTAINQIWEISSAGVSLPEQLQGETEVGQAWIEVVNGLPKLSQTFEYQSNDYVLGDSYAAWLSVFKSFWQLLILLLTLSIVVNVNLRKVIRSNKLLLFFITLLVIIISSHIILLDFLQVSSGAFLDLAGPNYLLMVYPILTFILTCLTYLNQQSIKPYFDTNISAESRK